MKAIFKRELKSYFLTASGYVYLVVFLSISSLIFGLHNLSGLSSDLFSFFSMMSYVWMLLTPILVMRLIAGERKNLTEQLLLSAPVKISEIVLGKYLAAVVVLLIGLLLSLLYPLLIGLQGQIYPAELTTLYLGFALQGCAFISFDLMISSLTKSQFSAVAVTFGVNLFLWLASIASSSASAPLFLGFNRFFNLYERFTPFLIGQLSIANLVYYLVFCFVCLYGATFIISSRRWNELS